MIDLSSAFESGGGAESTYTRVMQVIKTAKANTNLPTQKEKQDKSILIGIILLIVAILLIVFWLASENKEKIPYAVGRCYPAMYGSRCFNICHAGK